MPSRFCAAAATLAFASAAFAEPLEFSHAGTLAIDGGAGRSATLHVACSPEGRSGALGIDLVVPEASTRKDFDYVDFEGPDAVAGSRAPSRVTWTGGGRTTEITHAAAGWYAPEPAGSFMFGISQMAHHRDAPSKLLRMVGGEPGTLVWTQDGAGKPARQLVARFELDLAAADKLRATVAGCLPGGTLHADG